MAVSSNNPKTGKPIIYQQKGRVLKQVYHNGYRRVSFTNGERSTKRYFSVHRLVAFAFVPGYFDGAQVNHINEIRHDNRAENLEWVTPKQNINHGGHNQRQAVTKGRRVVQYDKQGNEIARFVSLSDASRHTGILRENIGKCCNHIEGWITAGGYVWEFEGNPFTLRQGKDGSRRAVAQYSKDGVFIRQYGSIKEAAEATGANPIVISRVLDTKYRAKKFLWKSVINN